MASPSISIELLRGTEYWRAAATATARSWREMLVPGSLAKNASAGLTIALVAIPLNLALALACGLPAGVGIVTGAIAGMVGALLGGSRLQVTGPEVALAPVSIEIVSRYGIEGLIAATFLAGMIQIGFGALRIGRLVHSIPVPVVGGFMTAVGLLVFDAQIPRLLGMPSSVSLLSDIRDVSVLTSIDPVAVALGVTVIALFVLLPRIHRAIPAPLVAMGVAIAATIALGLTLPMVQPITHALPSLALPAFGSLDLGKLFPEALALAMLASIDSLLCAVAVDARTPGERTRTDQELVAQGLANMTSACFGGMPVAAAVVRSVAAVEAGATTRFAPFAQSLMLGVVLLVLAPFVAYVPLVALAGILLVVGARLVELRTLHAMWRVARVEALVFVATAAGILLTDFVLGVGIGVVAALVHFAHQQRTDVHTIARGDVVPASPIGATLAAHSGGPLVSAGTRAHGIRIEGPLFFGSQADIDAAVREAKDGDHVVIDVSGVTTVDVSGATALAKVLRHLATDGTTVSIHTGGRALDPVLRYILDRCRADGIEIVEHHERTTRAVFASRSTIPPKERPSRIDGEPIYSPT